MSTGTAVQNSSYFRRRIIGRASSPPTWACYEQIHDDDDDDDDYSDSQSEDISCSEDEEGYGRRSGSDPDGDSHRRRSIEERQDDTQNMEIDQGACEGDNKDNNNSNDSNNEKTDSTSPPLLPPLLKKDVKGKQRAVDPEPEPMKRRHRRRERRPTHTLRPILTIQKSQGFVWNQVRFPILASLLTRGHHAELSLIIQDLFVPPYIKDRCSCLILLFLVFS